jgi:hypothetical protein
MAILSVKREQKTRHGNDRSVRLFTVRVVFEIHGDETTALPGSRAFSLASVCLILSPP